MQPNFATRPDGSRQAGPIMSISVAELRRRGLGHMEAGDVNHDGWLDLNDVVLVLMGTPPKSPAALDATAQPPPAGISNHGAGAQTGPAARE